jgi:hypothetical protein
MSTDDDASPLAGTEVHYLKSSHVGDELKIFVGWCGTAGEAPLHALYLTDANGWFGAAVDAIRGMQLSRHLPPILVVGIGYRRGGLADTVPIRARDLTPSHSAAFAEAYPHCPESGGAPKLLDFVRDELAPWVADRYPVVPGDAAYFGHSMGGLFGTYALLRAPDTFTRYVLGSPSYWWDDRMIFDLEAEYAAAHDDLAARVFFGIGDAEDAAGRVREVVRMDDEERALTAAHPIDMVATMHEFADRLTARGYPNLTVERQVFTDEFHVTVAPLVLSRGLRFVFDAPRWP